MQCDAHDGIFVKQIILHLHLRGLILLARMYCTKGIGALNIRECMRALVVNYTLCSEYTLTGSV